MLEVRIEARAARAERKQAAELIPDQAMRVNPTPLPEAKDRSDIENIVTTTDRLFRHARSGEDMRGVHPGLMHLLGRDDRQAQPLA